MSDILRPGEKQAKRAAAESRESIAKQKQVEDLRLAEETGEIARRKAATKAGQSGRSLLVATSPTGTRSTTLGGGA